MYFSARKNPQICDISHKIMAFERNVFHMTKVLQSLPRISSNCEDLIGISDVLSHRNPLSLV